MNRGQYFAFDAKVKPITFKIRDTDIFVEKLHIEDIPVVSPAFDALIYDLAEHAIPTGHAESDLRNYQEVVSRHHSIFLDLVSIATGVKKSWIEQLTDEERGLFFGGFYLVNIHFLLAYV